MTSIQFSGVSSSLDTKSIIDALMTPDQAQLTRLQTRQTDLASRQTAINAVRTSFQDLLAKLRVFTEGKVATSMAATSADATAFTATGSSRAVAASYAIQVNRLATTTIARSTAGVGTPITDGSQALSTLPLAGSVTAGTIGVVVDGTIAKVTVGDPASTTLDDVGSAIAAAITTEMQKTDGAATATYSISGNRIQFAITGATGSHTVTFGAGGDSSNALGILGLTATGGSVGAGTTITGNRLLGVVRATATLGSAFAGLAGTTGTLSVNGVDFAWDASSETLTNFLSRINASSAGVTASIDRSNDRVVLTSKTTGSAPIDIRDTAGGLAAALKLAPGTTGAQSVGLDAQVTVNGTPYLSGSNSVTNAIDGVTLNLVGETSGTRSLSVAMDRSAITSSLTDVVNAYNATADLIDSYTSNDPKSTTIGILANDSSVTGLLAGVRQLLFTPTSAAGAYNNLGAIGVNSGAFGSAVGSTSRLNLDATKLNAALDANPSAVSDLLGSSSGAIKPLVDRINAYAGIGGIYYQASQSLSQQQTSIIQQEADTQTQIDDRRAALEAKYAAMESLLSSLQATSNQLSAQTNAKTTSTG